MVKRWVMMIKEYRCRHLRPEQSKFALVKAKSEEDAAQEFHLMDMKGVRSDSKAGYIFSIIEVDGKQFVSRIFYEGIWRVGGIKKKVKSIEEIAELLGVPVNLLEGDWIGECDEGISISNIQSPIWDKSLI